MVVTIVCRDTITCKDTIVLCNGAQECPRNQSGRDKDSERNLSGICGEDAE